MPSSCDASWRVSGIRGFEPHASAGACLCQQAGAQVTQIAATVSSHTSMRPHQVPTRKDWGDLKVDPERGYAYRLFGGKTVQEAMPLFAENPVERAAELQFTPTAVFSMIKTAEGRADNAAREAKQSPRGNRKH